MKSNLITWQRNLNRFFGYWNKVSCRRELEKRRTEESKQMEDRSENDFVTLITFSDEDIDDMADKLSYWPKDVEIFRQRSKLKYNKIYGRGSTYFLKILHKGPISD